VAPIIHIEKLSRKYRSGDKDLIVFHDLSLDVTEGEQVAIIGESGAGKSTLLHLISGLDRPTAGAISYKGRDITALPEAELAEFRNREIGLAAASSASRIHRAGKRGDASSRSRRDSDQSPCRGAAWPR
jgi:ABC-type lipoprotein export system ATPase subunit